MLLRVPYYYENFFCQASKCKHSCCVGWEIDVDKEKEKYYKSVPGSFGERLRREMTEDDKFRLKGERCAFLNEENLCDIFIALGEDALCETCSEYPRFCIRYGNIMERGLGLSCEEAARLLFLEDVPFSLVEKEVEEPEEEEMPVEEKYQKNCFHHYKHNCVNYRNNWICNKYTCNGYCWISFWNNIINSWNYFKG